MVTAVLSLAAQAALNLLSSSYRLVRFVSDVTGTSGGPRLAVVIDADNIPPAAVSAVVAEARGQGTVTVLRAYGDWSRPHLAGWKVLLLEQGIRPVQQFAYTSGKNATDSAMIIDVMDLLHTRVVDGFCLVSSDSDFTSLALRIREAGLPVHGFGERKTPKPFVASCTSFTTIGPAGAPAPIQPPPSKPKSRLPNEVRALIAACVQTAAKPDGWTSMTALGQQLRRVSPGFDQRTHGFRRLADLVNADGRYELRSEADANGGGSTCWVRPTAL